MQTLEDLNRGQYKDVLKLKLSCSLTAIPDALLLCRRLEMLDLSDNQLSTLPSGFVCLDNLKILFLSNNQFITYPLILGSMPKLEMVAFKGNSMTSIPEEALGSGLRWLILTNNKITHLPKTIGRCENMQKLMLAGNNLEILPEAMNNLQRLELLRLSVNRLTTLPSWLLRMPCLSFLAFSGNPMPDLHSNQEEIRRFPWSDFKIDTILGQGASGIIYRAHWISQNTTVAVKVFKGQITSDGSPMDEMNACVAAGRFPEIISTIAKVYGHPEEREALVLELITPIYTILGQPPSFESCTRDCYEEDTTFSWSRLHTTLLSVAAAAAFLHSRGVSHGDLYAHNTLVNQASGHALLGDFGAATVYGTQHIAAKRIERIEVRAFGLMIDDLLSRHKVESFHATRVELLWDLCRTCLQPNVDLRLSFQEILRSLQGLADA